MPSHSHVPRYASEHANPQGAGDSRPTALQIVQNEEMVGNMQNKVIMVTGASSGIGIETARALHATGAKLFLPVRNVSKGEQVKKDILATSQGKGEIVILEMDLEGLDSVRACADEFLKQSSLLNILVNNAGIMALPERRLSKQGHELQFAVCHLAHFLLFWLLEETILKSATPEFPSKVVNLSSVGHHLGPMQFDDLTLKDTYEPWAAYAQAKLGPIWMANTLDRLYGKKGIHSLSVMPGGIATNLQAHTPDMAATFDQPEVAAIMKSPAQGAATTVWAAIGREWMNEGGLYLENCTVAEPWKEETGKFGDGYAPTAYNPEDEDRLWRISCELVGVTSEI